MESRERERETTLLTAYVCICKARQERLDESLILSSFPLARFLLCVDAVRCVNKKLGSGGMVASITRDATLLTPWGSYPLLVAPTPFCLLVAPSITTPPPTPRPRPTLWHGIGMHASYGHCSPLASSLYSLQLQHAPLLAHGCIDLHIISLLPPVFTLQSCPCI